MLRAFLLSLSQARWAKSIVTHMGLARRVALRFVAGEQLADALAVVQTLNAKGITATIDVLGESVTDAGMARAAAESYLHLIDLIGTNALDAWVSLKLTQLGLDIDEGLCHENMRTILSAARDHGMRVTIDMESSAYTGRTLDLFDALWHDDGFENVRTVLQAYLYRTDDDIAKAAESGAGIRLCKGAYREPHEVAYPKKADVDASYVRQMKALLDAAREGRGYPGIATHDAAIIEQTKTYAAEHAIPRECFEFQMLHGIRADLQDALASEGYRMRVYVPVGMEWYPYFMRRLAERPANLWFFVSNLLRR